MFWSCDKYSHEMFKDYWVQIYVVRFQCKTTYFDSLSTTVSPAWPCSLWQVDIFLFHVYKGGWTMFSLSEKYSHHGRFKDYGVKMYVKEAFDPKLHILTVFPQLWAKHVLPAFDKLTIQ
jgi:hypothetical protein